MKNIVIAGAGGMAQETKWLIERINEQNEEWNFRGFVTNDSSLNDEVLLLSKEELYVAIAIGSPKLRQKLFELYRQNPNLKFPNLIDPTVICSPDCVMGEGNIICANSIITTNAKIGNFNIINLNCTLSHDIIIRNYCIISPSVSIAGNVTIEDGADIGIGTKVIQGKKIGRETVVGAGAVVITDIPDNKTAVGVPAKVIK